MTMTTTFTIQAITGKDYHYDIIGSIDASSASVLDPLSNIPAESHVLLDFANVERVNSMGLSLLLKLFEDWERNRIRVEVQHLNRMINMLFKITTNVTFINVDSKDGNHKDQCHFHEKISESSNAMFKLRLWRS